MERHNQEALCTSPKGTNGLIILWKQNWLKQSPHSVHPCMVWSLTMSDWNVRLKQHIVLTQHHYHPGLFNMLPSIVECLHKAIPLLFVTHRSCTVSSETVRGVWADSIERTSSAGGVALLASQWTMWLCISCASVPCVTDGQPGNRQTLSVESTPQHPFFRNTVGYQFKQKYRTEQNRMYNGLIILWKQNRLKQLNVGICEQFAR